MKTKKLALVLALIAGILCLTAFVIKLTKGGQTDYTMLFAGIFVIALGVSSYYRKQ